MNGHQGTVILWDQNTEGWPVKVSKAGRKANLAASKVVFGEKKDILESFFFFIWR